MEGMHWSSDRLATYASTICFGSIYCTFIIACLLLKQDDALNKAITELWFSLNVINSLVVLPRQR